MNVTRAPVVQEYAALYYYDGTNFWINSSYIDFAVIGLRVDNISDEGTYTVYAEVVNGADTILYGYINVTLDTSTTYIGGWTPYTVGQVDPVYVRMYAKRISG